MSRIESSDDQRIREMQEAQLRQKVDTEKRLQTEKVSKSFNDVMSQRAKSEQQKRAERSPANKGEKPKTEVKNQKERTEAAPKANTELARRAELTRQTLVRDTQQRSDLQETNRTNELSRKDELYTRGDDEREVVDREVQRGDVREFQRAEARHEELKVDPDQPREQGRSRERDERKHDGDEAQPRSEGVRATEGPRAAQVVKIPTELLAQIADSMHVALDKSGGTEVIVSLKGTMLDGVTLRVSSKKGKVRAVFEGCDKQTKNLIESSRGELMRQLGKRGLELDILRAS
ncbi:MAG: hypothetical protein HY791_32520 [Deltaproteobacteria bacterium]|nr:hypothetical protein [Deltaproteobacteria bacterium]